VPRSAPKGGHRRRRGRSRPRLVLLDYPDSEGVTRELVIGGRRRPADRKTVLIATASATLVLAAALGARVVLRSGATGPAPGIRIPLVPFPPAASGSPPLIVTLRGTRLTPSTVPAQNAARVSAPARSAASLTPGAAPSPAVSARQNTQQAIAVRYLIVAQAGGGYQFEGEVHVVNGGSAPVSDWRIAVTLPDDRITGIGGAGGYVSNHILLLRPAPDAGPLAAGGQLRVFFTAEGPELTPAFCAFDDTPCG
jgi:hypothetical protein